MVAVEDLDPPEQEKIKSEPMGVPTSAPPKEALAERAGARGTSADVLPEERYVKGTAKLKASRTISITLSIAREQIFGDCQQGCI